MKLLPLLGGVLLIGGCSAPPQSSGPRHGQPLEVLPAAVRDACDLAASSARDVRAVNVVRTLGTFQDERAGVSRRGCLVSVTGSFAALQGGKDVFEQWREAFAGRGWQEQLEYAADGPDGTAFAFAMHGVVCLFHGRWDGGDDTEPDARRDDAYQGSASCAASGPGTFSSCRR